MPRRSTLRATPTPPPLGPGRQPATPGTAPAAAVGRLTRDAGIDPLRAPVMLDARLPARGMHEALASILVGAAVLVMAWGTRSEEHTSELQSLMRHSYDVFCLKKK